MLDPYLSLIHICKGGLCITPCGQKLAEEQDVRDNARPVSYTHLDVYKRQV